MFKKFRTPSGPIIALILALTIGQAVNWAQAALTATTLSAAVTSTQKTVTLASATNVSAGVDLYIDAELMRVLGVATGTTTTFNVLRGQGGTATVSHASGAGVYVGPPNYFSQTDPSGTCTRTSEVALPRIVPKSGSIYECSGNGAGSMWTLISRGGYPASTPGALSSQTYTAAGAITIAPGVSFINGTTLAMTLANPTVAQNGMMMTIIATNASAHTVTYTAGFNGGTTARDVATFGGAVGDNIVIFANGGVWWVVSTRNVTLA